VLTKNSTNESTTYCTFAQSSDWRILASYFEMFPLFLKAFIAFGCAAATTAAAVHDGNTTIPLRLIGHDVHGLPVNMPLLGAGTWLYNDTIAYQSLCKAFSAGINFVDTAYGYHNQKGVGKAIRDCYQGRREDLFVLTKIPGGLTAREAHAHHHQNMFELNLEYVDHLMAHFPSDWDVSEDRASKKMRQEEWRALEEIYYTGKARTIGVSHYCPQHIQDVLEIATVPISINQVEYHVGSQDIDGVIDICGQHNITFMSFSPLCGPCEIEDPKDSLITGDLVTSIGQQYGVSGSQVALRFIVQQSLEKGSPIGGVIPKSNNMDHILENRDIFSFKLSEEDMKRLVQSETPAAEGGRLCCTLGFVQIR